MVTARNQKLYRCHPLGMSQELADLLLPHLEAVANLHYLLDVNIEKPERLKELRLLEEKIFGEMLQTVLEQVKEGQTGSG